MTLIATLKTWLPAPPVTGGWAMAGVVALIAVPTLVRLAVDGDVTGVAFTPYSPAVLVAAVLLGAPYAALVALAGAVIGDALFVGARYQMFEGPTDLFGVFAFLLTATLIIGLVEAVRSLILDWMTRRAAGEAPSGVVFSLDRGEAWASWYAGGPPVRLGPQEEVSAMMQDFLAQLELGKRLTRDRS